MHASRQHTNKIEFCVSGWFRCVPTALQTTARKKIEVYSLFRMKAKFCMKEHLFFFNLRTTFLTSVSDERSSSLSERKVNYGTQSVEMPIMLLKADAANC